MKKIIILLIAALLIVTGCANQASQEATVEVNEESAIVNEDDAVEVIENEDTEKEEELISPYRRIEAETAKDNMAADDSILLLDVRTEAEYKDGHIPGASLLPLDTISQTVESEYPDKEQTIYVYCRSGRRSEASAAILLDLGYKNVFDLGGINNWPYEIE